MILFLGLVSWLLLGLVVGLLAARLLPGRPPLGIGAAVLVSLAASLVGGLLATWLGFGGLATYDLRALCTVLLCCLSALTWWRVAKLAS